MKNIEKTIQGSAIWAAYGDILGFITELTDSDGVKRRTGQDKVYAPLKWQRLIGGRYGTKINLLAGTYSDDTQLRLSTARAIYSNGSFDVEAFAKVELPVWLSYSLGAGRGTKAAANSLRHQGVNWFSNFFDKDGSSYLNCGGNGAAMRIQPHVWVSRERGIPESYIVDVIKNSICTHGHTRGIVGAIFHAMCLAHTIFKMEIPGPKEWHEILDYIPITVDLIKKDNELSNFWLPVWEDRAGIKLKDAFIHVQEECVKDIEVAIKLCEVKSEKNYVDLVSKLGAMSDKYKGSGTKTSIIAAILSWMHRDSDPSEAMFVASNLIGSDTDTIATMAGAMLGAVSDSFPSGEILDKEYILADASRLAKISQGVRCDNYNYPDLISWDPPKTQLDSLGRVDDEYFVSGLGKAKPVGEQYEGRSKGTIWEWIKLDIGQTLLIKRRPELKPTTGRSLPMHKVAPDNKSAYKKMEYSAQTDLFDKKEKNIHELTSEAIRLNFDPQIIGRHILEIVERPQGIELAVAYVAIIGKAKIARSEAQQRNSKT